MDRSFYIYVAFRPWDGSPCYVGKGKGRRWLKFGAHDRRNPHLIRIVAKAKRLGQDFPVIKVREGLSEIEAFDTERAFIAAIGRGKYGPLVNLTEGGEGPSGCKHSVKSRAITSAKSIKMWDNAETRTRIIEAQNAGKSTPEYRSKRSAISTALAADPNRRKMQSKVITQRYRDSKNKMITSIATTAAMATSKVKANVSAAQKKRYERPEEKALAATRATGQKASAETRAKMTASHLARYAHEREVVNG